MPHRSCRCECLHSHQSGISLSGIRNAWNSIFMVPYLTSCYLQTRSRLLSYQWHKCKIPLVPIAIGIGDRINWLIKVGVGKAAAPLFPPPPPVKTTPVAELAEARMIYPKCHNNSEHFRNLGDSKWQGQLSHLPPTKHRSSSIRHPSTPNHIFHQ